jgi:precorrin-6B methylase 2
MTDMRLEPGSFRDRHGRVFYVDGGVYRGLSAKALADWESLSQTDFFGRAMARGDIITTQPVNPDRIASTPSDAGTWAGVLKHDTVPFVSYPYEWSFSMLRDAARLHLRLLAEALDEDFTLKDASAYNVQWLGAAPVFIDIPSFERRPPGHPWAGYRQFCQLFLFSFVLHAYKGVSFRPWLRGQIDGIEPHTMAGLFTGRFHFKPGVLTHIALQAKLQAKTGDTKRNVKADLERAGFNKAMIQANVNRLRRLVDRLTWRQSKSEWSHYTELDHYSDADKSAKDDFVYRAVATRHWASVWDIGANTGEFSRIAANHADYVVAMDADELAVERMYLSLRERQASRILPLVVDLADASPALGWRGMERKSLTQRQAPQLTMCLALIHHIVIGANIPLPEFVDWLAELNSALIIEFIGKQDPMAQQLLRNKDDVYEDYDETIFEDSLNRAYTIADKQTLGNGNRTLYFAQPKSNQA